MLPRPLAASPADGARQVRDRQLAERGSRRLTRWPASSLPVRWHRRVERCVRRSSTPRRCPSPIDLGRLTPDARRCWPHPRRQAPRTPTHGSATGVSRPCRLLACRQAPASTATVKQKGREVTISATSELTELVGNTCPGVRSASPHWRDHSVAWRGETGPNLISRHAAPPLPRLVAGRGFAAVSRDPQSSRGMVAAAAVDY